MANNNEDERESPPRKGLRKLASRPLSVNQDAPANADTIFAAPASDSVTDFGTALQGQGSMSNQTPQTGRFESANLGTAPANTTAHAGLPLGYQFGSFINASPATGITNVMGPHARKSRAASTKSSGDQFFGTDTGTGVDVDVDAEATTRPRRRTRTIAAVIEEARTNAAGTKAAGTKAAGTKAAGNSAAGARTGTGTGTGTNAAGINAASTNAAGTKSADTASTATGTTPQHQGRSLQACTPCRRRKGKCKTVEGQARCEHCEKTNRNCFYEPITSKTVSSKTTSSKTTSSETTSSKTTSSKTTSSKTTSSKKITRQPTVEDESNITPPKESQSVAINMAKPKKTKASKANSETSRARNETADNTKNANTAANSYSVGDEGHPDIEVTGQAAVAATIPQNCNTSQGVFHNPGAFAANEAARENITSFFSVNPIGANEPNMNFSVPGSSTANTNVAHPNAAREGFAPYFDPTSDEPYFDPNDPELNTAGALLDQFEFECNAWPDEYPVRDAGDEGDAAFFAELLAPRAEEQQASSRPAQAAAGLTEALGESVRAYLANPTEVGSLEYAYSCAKLLYMVEKARADEMRVVGRGPGAVAELHQLEAHVETLRQEAVSAWELANAGRSEVACYDLAGIRFLRAFAPS